MQAWAAAILLFSMAMAAPARGEGAAVLPFGNAAPRASAVAGNLDWIGESIAETLRDALTIRGVVTPDRDEVQKAYRSLRLRERAILTSASVMKVGEAADAEQVIYGRFEFQPSPAGAKEFAAGESRGSLRVSARVLDRRKMRQSPEFEESGALDDLPALEAHLAWRALTIVAENLAPPEDEFRSLRPAIRLDAEESYIRGLMAHAPEQREKYFMQAARLDARFAHPCYQLGVIHHQRKEYRQAAEWLQKVTPDDIDYHRASFLLGLALFESGDYAGSQKAFQAVAAAAPLSEVYNNLAAAESRRDLPQALDDFRRALQGDSNDPVYHFNTGYALYRRGDFAAAAERFRAVLERNPADQMATLLLERCLNRQGLRPEANSGDARFQNLERLKTAFEERAYLQLKSLLDRKRASSGAP